MLGVYLRCLAGNRLRSWLRWLPWVEFCYNTPHQMTFQVVYGRPLPMLASYQSGLHASLPLTSSWSTMTLCWLMFANASSMLKTT